MRYEYEIWWLFHDISSVCYFCEKINRVIYATSLYLFQPLRTYYFNSIDLIILLPIGKAACYTSPGAKRKWH